MKAHTVVLFDIDGTLLDSEELIISSYEHALRGIGMTVERPQLKQLMGIALHQAYLSLVPDGKPEDLVSAHRHFTYENLHLIQPYPGLEHMLQTLQARGYKLGAVTNRTPMPGVDMFSNSCLGKYLEVVVTANDVVNPKPHPEPVLKAISQFQARPQEAVLVGDSPADIMAGKAAGVTTVGAVYGTFGPEIHSHNPDYIIHSLHGLLELL